MSPEGRIGLTPIPEIIDKSEETFKSVPESVFIVTTTSDVSVPMKIRGMRSRVLLFIAKSSRKNNLQESCHRSILAGFVVR